VNLFSFFSSFSLDLHLTERGDGGSDQFYEDENCSYSLDEYDSQFVTDSRSRSYSEPKNLEDSVLRDVMSGISTNKQPMKTIDPPTQSQPSEEDVKTTGLPEYESLSTVMKRFNRDSVAPTESSDDYADAGQR
jgi:hypothetical protein